jgi:predicted metal-dependent hydrolase
MRDTLPYFNLGSNQVAYSVVKGTSRRYTYFHFRPDLTLEVVLPKGRPVDVESAIRERTSWLLREYERMSMTKSILRADAVMIGGMTLRAVFHDWAKDMLVPDLARGVVDVYTGDRRRFKELVRRWFLHETSAYVVRRVAELAPRVGAKPTKVDVREMAKWGYCTKSGRLSFSWQLIALPDRLRVYVILHELTHLLEFNHSAAFRRRLGTVLPDFRDLERELSLFVPYDRFAS